MSVFRQTDSGDLYRPDGAKSFERLGGIEQSRQHLRSRLRIFRREVFSDQRIGLAFFELVTNPRTKLETIANHMNSIALGTPGVVDSRLQFEFEPQRGVLDVDARVTYSVDDQRDRVPIHERIQVTRGGSIVQ